MPLIKRSFIKSKKLYAINPSSFTVTERKFVNQHGEEHTGWNYSIKAVWYATRNNGYLAAFFGTIGTYHTSNNPNTKTNHEWSFEEFLEFYNSARYGGNPHGCWDGEGTWWNSSYSDSYAEQQAILPFLQDQLDNYPNIPAGYDGWYMLKD